MRVMALESIASYLRTMNIGSYFRIEGVLVAGAVSLYVQARDGVFWEIGKLKDVAHLLQTGVPSKVFELALKPWR